MFQTTSQNTTTVSAVMHHPPIHHDHHDHHDPRPDLHVDSAAWEQVLAVLADDIEPYSILKSLRFAGAYIDKGNVIWRHTELVMPHDDVHRDFLIPNKDAIVRALALLEE